MEKVQWLLVIPIPCARLLICTEALGGGGGGGRGKVLWFFVFPPPWARLLICTGARGGGGAWRSGSDAQVVAVFSVQRGSAC